MEGPGPAPELLRSHDRAHLGVDVEESDPVVGQLQKSFELLLQVDDSLLQVQADGLHAVATADGHQRAAGPQVHLGQRRQGAIF